MDETSAQQSSADSTGQAEQEVDRLGQPMDDEQPPRLAFPVVGIGASAGGLEACMELLKAMRPDSGMAFVLVQHLPPDRESLLPEILSKRTAMPVRHVKDGMALEPNHVYVILPGHTLTIKNGVFRLGERVDKPMHSRPVDDFFRSLAEEQRQRAISIIMSGMGSNGTAGCQAIKAVGGLCIAQDPESAKFPSMPKHLIDAGYADYILRPQDMPDVLLSYAGHPYARGEEEPAGQVIAREQQHLREILAVLRTRTRQDFSGYKKPTLVRRIQRRMGLSRVTKISEYVKLLRQNPTEVAALATDFVIHVTGFFRDAEAWEALRERVIVPLVASREAESSIRCWVTACSSGEEAYTLAMLLVEEAERSGKPLDIKVFATDVADRTLQNARHGLFPGGIEAEISPERLARFFQREDAVYRVRQDLRECVVFAPQNVLYDPPFSRLDIATCRNLLIYLEPPVQQRVLALLHFGLREGAALFLGTSETIAGADDLYEPIDKKARIFRRTGPTRHGTVDFPLPHRFTRAGEAARTEARQGGRVPVAQLTARALLEHHTPAAVTIDRDYRIVYFHGNTDQFLAQPRGETTRDLLSMARESLRGTLRTALHQATARNAAVTIPDGALDVVPDKRQRVAVTVSPLDGKATPDYYVVSFHLISENAQESPDSRQGAAGDDQQTLRSELKGVRDELQSTIEELQASNEELKASHEEVMSTNEELQSSNEELETSREEMQSLNEELTTVNAQLLAKIEEHQTTSNDLSSLLTSTDIAVLFLDTQFQIRRFTPAMRDLLELIASDVGRPLSDLARKFEDPDLIADAESVLVKLAPMEREIRAAELHRWYLRRVTPYRTTDHRIDGVVITFVDISSAKRDEKRLAEQAFMLANVSDAVIAIDLNDRITYWSPSAERLHGYTEQEAVGRPSAELLKPRYLGTTAPEVMQRVVNEGQVKVEAGHTAANGRAMVLDSHLVLLRNMQGVAVGILMIHRDITGRKEMEQHLAADHAGLLRLSELSIQLIGQESFQTLLQAVNDAAVSLTGAAKGTFYLYDGAAQALRLAAYSGFQPDFLEQLNGVAKALFGAGTLQGLSERVVVENVAASAHFLGSPALSLLQAAGVQALQFTPMTGRDGSLLGVIATYWSQPQRPGEGPLRRLDLLTREAANLIEYRQREESLRVAKAAAESANHVKDEFLATLSHELRTPLSSILLWTKILLGELKEPRFREGLDAIKTGAEAQKILIDDLLDISRITAGKLRLQTRAVDIAQIIHGAAEAVVPMAKIKDLHMEVVCDPAVGPVRVDPDRFRQVVWNLLINAVKFTQAGGRVDIALKRVDENRVSICVADNGRGIAPDFLAHIFDPFHQAEAATTRTQGGLGLGLAIVKRLVEMHGGSVRAESPGLGHGATFTLELPLVKTSIEEIPEGVEVRATADFADLKGLHILVVEDNAPTRQAIVALLTRLGVHATAAESAPAAFEAFRQGDFDLLISDIGLPGEDGYSLVRRIREHEGARKIAPLRAIALSAFAGHKDHDDALEAGYQVHLAKPVDPEELLDVVRRLAAK